ncbi:plasmid mobilization protein [Flavobacterium ammonificans]|uniref:plasmid mobilization protein n=1 Tax=Flavobacterium ammonificans TaxID=1751056 RepID=UPI001E415EBB|nr:hypothetical protein [Flavobacterium ammonificans]BDB56080.1 hypothetical protein SHINM13_03760 [Flavobacterium ammonificans]
MYKGGRPNKEIKRTKEKRVLFTEDEFEQLNKMFKDSIYHSVNEMIRDILLKKEYKVVTLDNELREERNIIIGECRRVGNNFNQLIKNFNQKKLDYFTDKDIHFLKINIEQIKMLFGKIEENIKR